MSGDFAYARHMMDVFDSRETGGLEEKMKPETKNVLHELQGCVTNPLHVFRYPYFQGMEGFTHKGHNPKRGGDFEETRYRVSSLDFFNGFLFAGNVGGEMPSDYAKSVHFHNAVFQNEGVRAVAHGFDVEPVLGADKRPLREQPNFVRFLDAIVRNARQFLLLHVTDPYKTVAFDYAVQHKIPISDSAKISGVVNPFLFDAEGNIYGDNVDGYACLQAVEDWRDVSGKKILLVGAGGAASSIALEAVNRFGNGRLVIANRTVENAHKLAEKLRGCKPLDDAHLVAGGIELIPAYIADSDIVISAVTENPFVTEEIARRAPSSALFVDINYGAKAAVANVGKTTGHNAIDGTPMVYHGVELAAHLAFEKRFGKKVSESTLLQVKKEAGL